MMREQGGPRREEAVQGEAVSEEVMCGAAEHETDGGLWRRQMGCLVGVEGGPVWGWGGEGDLQVTR